jgi:hypothetical protein
MVTVKGISVEFLPKLFKLLPHRSGRLHGPSGLLVLMHGTF